MNKNQVPAVIGAIGLGALFLWLSRKKEGTGAKVSISIYDKNGNLVQHNSPASLVEGEEYDAVFTVTNQSTLGGNPCEAQFTIDTDGSITWDSTTLPIWSTPYGYVDLFSPGEMKEYTRSFTCPVGPGDSGSGNIDAIVYDPDANLIATGSEPVTTVVTNYDADVDVDVGGGTEFTIDVQFQPSGASVTVQFSPYKQLYTEGEIVYYSVYYAQGWIEQIVIYHPGYTETIPVGFPTQSYSDGLVVAGNTVFVVHVGMA